MSFGASFAAGAGVRQNRQVLQQREQELKQKERQQTIENINGIADSLKASLQAGYEAMARKGIAFDSPEAQQFVKPFRDEGAKLLGQAGPLLGGEVYGQEAWLKDVDSMHMFVATPKDDARLNRYTVEELESDPSIPPGFAQLARDGFLVEQNQHGMMVVSAAVAPDNDPDKREARILDVMSLWSVDRKAAVSVVDPNIARIEIHPVNGNSLYVNNITGEVRELKINPQSGASIHGGGRSPAGGGSSPGGAPSPGGSPAPAEDSEQSDLDSRLAGRTLYELAGIGTGPVSGAKQAASFGLGFLPEGMQEHVFPAETIEARSILEASTQALVRAFSNNPRFPEGEAQRILKGFRLDPRVLDNPAMMQARMRGLDYVLEQRQIDAYRDARDTDLPAESRRHARAFGREVENFRRQMGVPEPLSLDSIEDIQSADVETLRGFLNSASDADLDSLPDDVAAMILQRVKGQ